MRTFFRLSTIFLAFVVAAPLSAQIAEVKVPGPDGLWGTGDDTTTFVQRDPALRFYKIWAVRSGEKPEVKKKINYF